MNLILFALIIPPHHMRDLEGLSESRKLTEYETAPAAGIKMTMGKNFTNRVGFILHHAPRL